MTQNQKPFTGVANSQLPPLLIGATGHRDLVPEELPLLAERVRSFFMTLQQRFPSLPLQVVTPLAEGADRLVARVALELELPLLVPMPMAQGEYERDFASAESVAEFRALQAGQEVFELPLVPGHSDADIAEPGAARNLQYAQLGTYVAAHSHVLLALWDGNPSHAIGGTAQVVQFHQYDIMPGLTTAAPQTRPHFTADESDLVYHVWCSRQREGHSTREAGTTAWRTTDQIQPLHDDLPPAYAAIFTRMAKFADDVRQHESEISDAAYPLFEPDDAIHVRPGALRINRVFEAADWLALHFQRRVLWALRLIYTSAAAAGVCFIAYADLEALDVMIYPYLAFLLTSFACGALVARSDWQRRYLEYRALAEGLRVQFYWAVAGVRMLESTRFTHDSYLRSQDIELGWVRNVMRVTGTRADLAGDPIPDTALEYVTHHWVGGDAAGQTAYFQRKSRERAQWHRTTRTLGRGALLVGALAALILALAQSELTDTVRNTLIALMGLLPLLAVIRETFAQKRADQELVRQYQFMHGIFASAGRMLAATDSLHDKHHILRSLGSAALEENAEWLLRLRDRPLQNAGTPT